MKRLLFSLLLCFPFLTWAQTKNFQKSFGNDGEERFYSVATTTDSGFVLLGITSGFANRKKAYVVRLDSTSRLLWSKTYGSAGLDVGRSMAPTKDGGFVIVGTTTSIGAGKKDVWLLKIDHEGEVEWSHAYGGVENDYGFSVKQTLDGGYIIGGETNSFGTVGSDIYLLKTDEKGNLQWSKALGGKDAEYIYEVIETFDGFVFASETNTYGSGEWDIMLTKVDKKGELQWSQVYGGNKVEFGYDLIQTKDGGFVLVGSTYSFGVGGMDIYFLRTDKKGKLVVARTFGGGSNDQAHTVHQMPDEGFIIGGFSASYGNQLNAEDAYLIRLNKKNNLKWSKVFGGTFGDYALDMQTGLHGEILMVGETKSFNGRDDSDAYLIRTEDDSKLKTCELSRVQTQTILKSEFVTKTPELGITATDTKEATFDVESTEVLSSENVICDGNIQVIQNQTERKRQERKTKKK